MEKKLYLVRHAESAMNVQPHLVGGRSNEAELTPMGIGQARTLGRTLARLAPYAAVYASPAVRTRETARHALEAAGITTDITIDDALQEMDQGDYVGRDRSTVYTPEILEAIEREGKDFKLPGGESMNDVGERMVEWVMRHEAEAERGPLLVFGHGLAIRCLASYLEGWDRRQTFETMIANASLTTFTDSGEGWRLVELGRLSDRP